MDENAIEKIRELGFTYNKSEEHCRMKHGKGRFILII
jgi:hypothetical protein